MIVKLLTEHHLEFLSLKEAAEIRLSLHLSNVKLLKISCRDSIIYELDFSFTSSATGIKSPTIIKVMKTVV